MLLVFIYSNIMYFRNEQVNIQAFPFIYEIFWSSYLTSLLQNTQQPFCLFYLWLSIISFLFFLFFRHNQSHPNLKKCAVCGFSASRTLFSGHYLYRSNASLHCLLSKQAFWSTVCFLKSHLSSK